MAPPTATQERPAGLDDENLTIEECEARTTDHEMQADAEVQRGEEEAAQLSRNTADAWRQKAAELRQEAGEPTGQGDPAAESAAAEQRDREEPEPEKVIVRGIEIPYLNAGGKKPTAGSLKFTGAKVELEHGTAFKKGMAIEFSGTAIIKKVAVADTHDPSTGQVTNAEQAHEARIVDLVVEIPAADV